MKIILHKVKIKKKEIWKTAIVNGKVTNYKVSNFGRIKSNHYNKIVKLYDRNGYLRVVMVINNRKNMYLFIV